MEGDASASQEDKIIRRIRIAPLFQDESVLDALYEEARTLGPDATIDVSNTELRLDIPNCQTLIIRGEEERYFDLDTPIDPFATRRATYTPYPLESAQIDNRPTFDYQNGIIKGILNVSFNSGEETYPARYYIGGALFYPGRAPVNTVINAPTASELIIHNSTLYASLKCKRTLVGENFFIVGENAYQGEDQRSGAAASSRSIAE